MMDVIEMFHAELPGQMCSLMHRFKRMHVMERIVSIPGGEFLAMSVLSNAAAVRQQESMRVSELAGYLRNTPAAASKMLSVLEDKGYIERFSDKRDRRITYVRLTPCGREVIHQEQLHIRDYVMELRRQFGEENCRRFMQMQEQILDITEEYLESLDGTGEHKKTKMEKEESETC
mgnify:CR=1 FL=1